MNRYITAQRGAQIIESGQTLQYPIADSNPIDPPFDTFAYPDFAGGDLNPPSPLVREVLPHINAMQRRVLDLGAGFSPTGLYLASQGHDVTAIDSDRVCVDWQNKHARQLGVEDRYRALRGDVHTEVELGKHDLVLAEMLLHFFSANESRSVLNTIQEATELGGLNIVSVYTTENPEAEAYHPNNRRGMFKPGLLRLFYKEREWDVIRSEEGLAGRFVHEICLVLAWVLCRTSQNWWSKKMPSPYSRKPAGLVET